MLQTNTFNHNIFISLSFLSWTISYFPITLIQRLNTNKKAPQIEMLFKHSMCHSMFLLPHNFNTLIFCFMVQFNRLYLKGYMLNMTIYVLLAIFLVVLGIGFEALNMYTKDSLNKSLPNYICIVPSFIAVFFVSAFRGDFMTDYVNYRSL